MLCARSLPPLMQGRRMVAGLSPAAWFQYGTGITVTGSGVSQWDDASGNGRHLLQGTDANRPIALLHTGTNYLYLPGVAGNYASTPDSVANSITGDIDIRVRCSAIDWTPSAVMVFVGKDSGGGTANRSFLFYLNTDGTLHIIWSFSGADGGVLDKASTAATGFTDGDAKWVRVTLDVNNGSGGNVVTFYTAPDSAGEPSSWTQLGTAVTTAGTTSIFDGTDVLGVGARTASGTLMWNGRIYRASIYSTIGGTTPVVDFNPADASDGAASFSSSTTGETWTINSTGSKPAQIVGSSSLLGDGAAHKMACSTYTANQPRTIAALVRAITWTAGDYIVSGVGAEAGITQVTSTPTIGLNAGSAAAANTGLTLGAWKVVVAVLNGANSSITINNGTPTTGNAGANNPAGLTLFSNNAGSGYFNGQIKELADFDGVLTAAQIASVSSYLMALGSVS